MCSQNISNTAFTRDLTPGNAQANKCVVLNINKDISGIRNLGITGAFTPATISTTGDVSIGGADHAYARLTIHGTNASATAGPHIISVTDADAYPQFQLLNRGHNDVWLSFDAHYNGTNWISGSSNGNFAIYKGSSHFRIVAETGIAAGSNITEGNFLTGLGIDSNTSAYFGGTNAFNHARVTLNGTNSSTTDGPLMAFLTSDAYPLLHIVPYTHDDVSIAFDASYDGTNWKSGDGGSNFRFVKQGDALKVQLANAVAANSNITWSTAMTFNSNTTTTTMGGNVAIQGTSTIYNVTDTNNYLQLSNGSTNALLNSAGHMNFNVATSKSVYHKVNNVTIMEMSSGGLVMSPATSTDTASTEQAFSVTRTYAPSSASSMAKYNVYGNVTFNSNGGALSGNLRNLYIATTATGSSSISSVTGLYSYMYPTATGTIASQIAGDFQSWGGISTAITYNVGVKAFAHDNPASVVTQHGVTSEARHTNASTTLSTNTALVGYASNTVASTVTNNRGLHVYTNNTDASGTITNNRAIHIADVTNNGTVTTNTGLHIEEIKGGTTNYAIYSAGGEIYSTQSTTATTAERGFSLTRTYAPSTASSATKYNMVNTASFNSTGGALTGSLENLRVVTTTSGSSAVTEVYGLNLISTNSATATVSAQYAVSANAGHTSSSTCSNNHAVRAYAYNTSTGTIDLNYGILVSTGNSNASGTINTNSAIHIVDVSNSGTVTTNNGLYIEEIKSGSTNWSIYSNGGNSYHKDAIGIGTSSISSSAKVEISSTTQGLRVPVMTTTQKNNISSPVTGLIVYDSDLAKLCIYTTAWETITSS